MHTRRRGLNVAGPLLVYCSLRPMISLDYSLADITQSWEFQNANLSYSINIVFDKTYHGEYQKLNRLVIRISK